MTTGEDRPEGFQRVTAALARHGHPHAPLWLEVAARTSQEAADALGVAVGQIAKSVVFRSRGIVQPLGTGGRRASDGRSAANLGRRESDDVAVLVIASGDRRVDEERVASLLGCRLGRADADFVKRRTGFSIGGVAPLAHASPPLTLIDRELFRFSEIWAAAGHPNGVFKLSPQQLEKLTGAPVADVVQVAGQG